MGSSCPLQLAKDLWFEQAAGLQLVALTLLSKPHSHLGAEEVRGENPAPVYQKLETF